MTLIFIWFYSILFFLFMVGLLSLAKSHIRIQKLKDACNQLEDVLDSAPDGYFCETHLIKNNISICSRRLCLALNIINKNTKFDTLLTKLNETTQADIKTHFSALKEKDIAFDINGQSANNQLDFLISGRVLYNGNKTYTTYIIWFKNITQFTNAIGKNKADMQKVIEQRRILTQTLNTLPFPLYVKDAQDEISFSNSTYTKNNDELNELHWLELPLSIPNKKEIYTLTYGQDKATEEGLTRLILDFEKAGITILKQLPYGVALFNASAQLTYFNNMYADIWHMEPHFLKRQPYYAEMLDKIQENGLLPHVKDYAQYKKQQMNLFAQLTKTTEDYIYLSNGDIIRRRMLVYAQGGILIIDEKKEKKLVKS